jgi:hypothetical protein
MVVYHCGDGFINDIVFDGAGEMLLLLDAMEFGVYFFKKSSEGIFPVKTHVQLYTEVGVRFPREEGRHGSGVEVNGGG